MHWIELKKLTITSIWSYARCVGYRDVLFLNVYDVQL